MHPRVPRLAATALAVAGLVAGLAMALSPPQAAAATTICERYGTTKIQGGRHVVQNNEWGANDGQRISASDTDFTITAGNHQGPPQPSRPPRPAGSR
ncbi:hypothetical protein [Saccharothrix deserti]|uniref:hypothetical protein n=1 Tax=Saccharothrix deserti TaxID=2593674 RepID=UPI00131C6FB2|nr:hypothetical protein [Saccharothrix deserti]